MITGFKEPRVDISVNEKEILGIIGPNGSGKSTLFAIINGLYKPTQGKIFFQGNDITGLAPYRIARCGLARTFQILRIFPGDRHHFGNKNSS